MEHLVDWATAPEPAAVPLLSAAGPVLNKARPNYPDRTAWTRLVFQGVTDQNWEIFLNEGSHDQSLIRLTAHTAADTNPRLSFNADAVVFVSYRDGNAEIYRVNADGAGLARLTANAAADGQPDWSPDGSSIVFVSDRGGSPALYRMDSAGAQVRQLTGGNDYNPVWSPDGTRIAWVRRDPQGLGQVWVMDADGANPHPLTATLSAPDRVDWSASGKRLVLDADLDQDGWYDTGWFELSDPENIHDACAQPAGIDCWLGGFYADDRYLIASRVSYTNQGGQDVISDAILYKTDLDSAGSPGYWLQFGSAHQPQANADAQGIDHTLPVSTLRPIPRYLPTTRVALTWDGWDPGPAGLFDYEIFLKRGLADAWTRAVGRQAGFNMEETGPKRVVLPDLLPGVTYHLASQGRDLAENLEILPAGADAVTTTYAVRALVQVSDARGQPLPGVLIQPSPAPVNLEEPRSGADGFVNIFHAANAAQAYQVEGLQTLPAHLDQDRELRVVLTAGDNAFANGGFESTLDGWTTGGAADAVAGGHSGAGARLGAVCPAPCQTAKEEFVHVYNPSLQLLVDSRDTAHLLVNHQDYWLRNGSGAWQHPDQPFGLPGSRFTSVARLDNQDTLHVFYGTQFGMIYLQKPLYGDWKNRNTSITTRLCYTGRRPAGWTWT
jgi:Tol biopolymer transport system component